MSRTPRNIQRASPPQKRAADLAFSAIADGAVGFKRAKAPLDYRAARLVNKWRSEQPTSASAWQGQAAWRSLADYKCYRVQEGEREAPMSKRALLQHKNGTQTASEPIRDRDTL